MQEDPRLRFQRLPSVNELNTLGLTWYEDNGQSPRSASPTSTTGIADVADVAHTRYVPIQASAQGPHQSNEQRLSPVYRMVGLIAHLILTLAPIIFLILAFSALSVDGQPLSHKGRTVLEAARVSPSLFPIVFAAVVGRLMRTLALWKAERGASIGVLEQLSGSQNLLSAVKRAFYLHKIGSWSLFVVVLWALSPVGGQSSLRVLNVTHAETAFTQTIHYFDTSNYSSTAFLGASSLNFGWASVSAIYQACLLAPDRVTSSSTDLWGNVKIPLMQSLPTYREYRTADWIPVPRENVTYSSLSGVVVSGLNQNAIANFTVESTYFNLSCSEPEFLPLNSGANSTYAYVRNVREWLGPVTYHSNISGPLFGDPRNPDRVGRAWNSFTIDTNWNYTNREGGLRPEINLIYLSQNYNDGVAAFNCSVGYTHAESWVNCDGLQCHVAKMRPSQREAPPPNMTPFNSGSISYYDTFLGNFPWATGEQHSGVTSPADSYISGSDNPYSPELNSGVSDGAVYTNVTGLQLARRLGTLTATFWQIGIIQSALVQPPSSNMKAVAAGEIFPVLQSSAAMQVRREIYAANRVWVSLTVIISFILFLCGIAGAAFKYLSTTPDILGYVSTLAKDNPYFHHSAGPDSLDGLERSRMLQHVAVQIGNVRPGESKAYIALRSISEGDDKRKGRLRQPTGQGFRLKLWSK